MIELTSPWGWEQSTCPPVLRSWGRPGVLLKWGQPLIPPARVGDMFLKDSSVCEVSVTEGPLVVYTVNQGCSHCGDHIQSQHFIKTSLRVSWNITPKVHGMSVRRDRASRDKSGAIHTCATLYPPVFLKGSPVVSLHHQDRLRWNHWFDFHCWVSGVSRWLSTLLQEKFMQYSSGLMPVILPSILNLIATLLLQPPNAGVTPLMGYPDTHH